MQVKKRLAEVTRKSILEEAKIIIQEEKEMLAELAGILYKNETIDAFVLARERREVVLPVDSNLVNPLERLIAENLQNSLASYSPVQSSFDGNMSYLIGKGRLPHKITFEINGKRFTVTLNNLTGIVDPSESNHEENIPKGNRFEIDIKGITPARYGLIPVKRRVRSHFPSYGVHFTLRFEDQKVETYVTSAPKSDSHRLEKAGTYIARNIRQLFKDQPERLSGGKLVFEVIEPGKEYRIR